MGVQIMVYAYLAVCVSMILFNCVCIILFKKNEKNSRKRDSRFQQKVKQQVLRVEQGEELSQKELKQLARRCMRVWNFAALDEQLDALRPEHGEAVAAYSRQMRYVYIYLAMNLHRKDNIQQAHYAYMVKKYDVVVDQPLSNILDFMLEMVQSPNIYCRENALRVLYAAGDVEVLYKALRLVDGMNVFHHEKMLTDGLLSFRGDKKELIHRLLSTRRKFSLKMQLIILNFVRFSGAGYEDAFLEVLRDEKEDDELRFSAIRYLGRFPHPAARPILLEMARNPQKRRWEYAAIAASALAAYPGDDTIETLKECLHNYSWYIRSNAAVSLERFNLTYMELADVLDSNDRYAREILLYRMEIRQQEEKRKKEAAAPC